MFWREMVLAPVAGILALAGFGHTARPLSERQIQDTRSEMQDSDAAPGQLTIIQKDGSAGQLCPLQRTSVNADVAGFGARVAVTQVFHNPTNDTIEAVYTFPLPENAAVDHMTMRIGDRVIEGVIKERQEARQIYETAKSQGKTAALLDQERPNIFTQSVANITPGAEVDIEIDYIQTLKFHDGTFEFNFPMVVGPRFLGNAPDPGKIAPPITPKGTRTGANIDLTVNVDAGAPVQNVESVLHQINTEKVSDSRFRATLARADEIPNRDFILRYQVADNSISDAFVTNMDTDRGGFFALALLPPKAITEQDITPREFIFVMDQSGSQMGFPIQKSKELTLKLIDTLRPQDTFNVIGFNNTVQKLFPSPQPNTPENIAAAKNFVQGMDANGGTQLREGLLASLDEKPDPTRLRIITFNTDGFVGDEKAILDTLQKDRQNARLFTFGIGNGVNRFLIDSMSAEGRGASEYVTLPEQADAAVQRFIQRTRTPVLTDVSVQVDGAKVSDLEPSYVPDVFDQSPVYVFGRYLTPGPAKITVSGKHGGKPWSRTIDVNLPAISNHPQIMSLWARDRVDSLTRQNWAGQFNQEGKDLKAEITETALQFGIMTEYTSFVAVEDKVVNVGGKQQTVRVPVEMASGVSYEGVGEADATFGYSSGMRGGAAMMPVGGYANSTLVPSSKVVRRISIRSADPAFVSQAVTKAAEVHGHAVGNVPSTDNKIDKRLLAEKGRIEVRIWLSSMDATVLNELKDQGVKIEKKDGKRLFVIARVNVEKLKAIAALDAVKRIEPVKP